MTARTCGVCDQPARRQQCNGDFQSHGHGMVHAITPDSEYRLMSLCDRCHEIDRLRWIDRMTPADN